MIRKVQNAITSCRPRGGSEARRHFWRVLQILHSIACPPRQIDKRYTSSANMSFFTWNTDRNLLVKSMSSLPRSDRSTNFESLQRFCLDEQTRIYYARGNTCARMFTDHVDDLQHHFVVLETAGDRRDHQRHPVRVCRTLQLSP